MRTPTHAFCLAAMLALASLPVAAADLRVEVDDGDGHAVVDAVVTLHPRSDSNRRAPAAQPPVRKTIDQKALAFVPYLQVFRPGDAVVFRNSDQTRHHVYSFSAAKAFEMVLAPGKRAAPLRLDRTGVVAVGCNIHDQMIAWLVVSDAPWIARTGSDGRASFGDLPAGEYTVRVWHPRLVPGSKDAMRTIVLSAGGKPDTLAFALSLRPDSRQRLDREIRY